MQKDFYVYLTPEMIELGKFLGDKRFKIAREEGIHNARHSPKGDEFVDRNGMCGEIAFLVGLMANKRITPAYFFKSLEMIKTCANKSAARKEDTGDIAVREGLVVDVKTTDYRDGHLIVKQKKLGCPIDAYALMVGDHTYSPRFEFRGIKSKTLLSQEWSQYTRSRWDVDAWVPQHACGDLSTIPKAAVYDDYIEQLLNYRTLWMPEATPQGLIDWLTSEDMYSPALR